MTESDGSERRGPEHGCGQGWNYNQSRPHLLTIYPTLAASYRTLIFNGDFDACVPYLHNGAAPIMPMARPMFTTV